MTDAILKFQDDSGQHTFLSNFYPSPIQAVLGNRFDDIIIYPTVEHYFQAQKSLDIVYQKSVAEAASPGKAKRLGRKVTLRPDWETVKYDVMRVGVSAKFYEGTELAQMLLDTGDAYLVEGNTWGDKVWGKVDGQGSNWLGIILMARRAELRYWQTKD